MGTAIKHLVPDRVKPSFVIFDMPRCQKLRPQYSAYTSGDLRQREMRKRQLSLAQLSSHRVDKRMVKYWFVSCVISHRCIQTSPFYASCANVSENYHDVLYRIVVSDRPIPYCSVVALY